MDGSMDLYTVLGVDPAATDNELDQAFRVLVPRHHPDTRLPDPNPSAAEAADRQFQQLLNAYAILRNPASRAIYDQQRPTHRNPQRPDAHHHR
jgi:curved DNA-binding protein CbpA